MAAVFLDVLPITDRDMALACDLIERHRGLPARDAVHAATMQNNGLETIISADTHFDRIPGIRRTLQL